MTTQSRLVRDASPNDRRRRSANAFLLRVGVLVALIAGVAYSAWFSPWARPIHTLTIETTPTASAR